MRHPGETEDEVDMTTPETTRDDTPGQRHRSRRGAMTAAAAAIALALAHAPGAAAAADAVAAVDPATPVEEVATNASRNATPRSEPAPGTASGTAGARMASRDAAAEFDVLHADPHPLLQLSVAAALGARLTGTDLIRGDSSVEDALAMGGLLAEMRVVSVLGFRGGVSLSAVGEGTVLGVRGGVAIHVLPSPLPADLYVFGETGMFMDGHEASVGERSVAAGAGFRWRIKHAWIVGLEGSFCHHGIPNDKSNPLVSAATRMVLEGESFDPHVEVVFGLVM